MNTSEWPNHPSQADERERLRRLLREDLNAADTADAQVSESLVNALVTLRRWQAPEAAPGTTAALLAALEHELPQAAPAAPRRVGGGLWVFLRQWWPLLVLRSQVRVVQGTIWAATGLVILLGTLVTITAYDTFTGDLLPLAVVAPVIAAVGLALLYDGEVTQMLELENSTRVSSRLLLLARLTLVFGFNLVLALLGSVALALSQSDLSLWALVQSWLGPMTFLSALAFFLSVLSLEPLVGMVISLFLWMVHLMLRSDAALNTLTTLLSLPGLGTSRPALFAASALMIAAALWIAGIQETSPDTTGAKSV